MLIAAWMIILALIFDVIGVGKRQWANRVAALLALGGMTRLLAPSKLGDQLREWAQEIAKGLGNTVAEYDPAWQKIVTELTVPAFALVTITIWFFLLLPASENWGPASKKEIQSRWIWGGAAVSAVFVSTIPGPLGELLTAIIGVGANISQTATTAVVTLAPLTGAAT